MSGRPSSAPAGPACWWCSPAVVAVGGGGRRLVAAVSARRSGLRSGLCMRHSFRPRGRQRAVAARPDRRRFHRRALPCAARRAGHGRGRERDRRRADAGRKPARVRHRRPHPSDRDRWQRAGGLAGRDRHRRWRCRRSAVFFWCRASAASGWSRSCWRWLPAIANWLVFGAIDDLFARLDAFYAYRRGLIRSVIWHLAGWFVGAIEVWVVLQVHGLSDRLRARPSSSKA